MSLALFKKCSPYWEEKEIRRKAKEWVNRGLLTEEEAQLVVVPEPMVESEKRIFVLFQRFFIALVKWFGGGMRFVSRATLLRRRYLCGKCPYWAKTSRFGLGECSHRRCGCTKAKWWLETESCPLKKW